MKKLLFIFLVICNPVISQINKLYVDTVYRQSIFYIFKRKEIFEPRILRKFRYNKDGQLVKVIYKKII